MLQHFYIQQILTIYYQPCTALGPVVTHGEQTDTVLPGRDSNSVRQAAMTLTSAAGERAMRTHHEGRWGCPEEGDLNSNLKMR